ncbi:MAG: S1C family serine protease, partial [Nitrospinales bacterium]
MVESLLKRKGLLKILVPLTGLAVVGSLLFFLEKKPRPPPAPPEEKTLSTHPSYSNAREYREILDIQKAFTRNAKRIKPAVVSVHNLSEIENASAPLRHSNREPAPWLLALKRWLLHLNHVTYQVEKFGSGLILDQEGHILTNYHLIKDADRLRIKLADGQEFLAKNVGFDPLTNLAVLKIFTFKRLPQVPLGRSYNLKTGEWVMAIGNPYGLEGTVTVGVVSGTGKTD